MTVAQLIINSLGKRLKQLYPEATIYQNDQEQGIEEPCFFISTIKASGSPMLSIMEARELPVQISALGWKRKEAIGIGETLLLELRHLPLIQGAVEGTSPSIHGFDMSYQPVDNDLHFQLTFKWQQKEIRDVIYMEDLIQIHKAEE